PTASAIAQAKADLQRDLIVADLAILDMATSVDHFEPVHVTYALGALGLRVFDGIFDAGTSRADDLDLLVGVVVGHGGAPVTCRFSFRLACAAQVSSIALVAGQCCRAQAASSLRNQCARRSLRGSARRVHSARQPLVSTKPQGATRRPARRSSATS